MNTVKSISLKSYDIFAVEQKIKALNNSLKNNLKPWFSSKLSLDGGLSWEVFNAALGPLMLLGDPFVLIGSIFSLDSFHMIFHGGKTLLVYGGFYLISKNEINLASYSIIGAWPFGIIMYLIGKNHDDNLENLNRERQNKIKKEIEKLENEKRRYSNIFNLNNLGIYYEANTQTYCLSYSVPLN